MQTSAGADEPITGINVTPLVDVSLVLVIIFMITMPYLMERALKVSASSDAVVPQSSMQAPLLIEVSRQGLKLEGQNEALSALPDDLKKIMTQRNVHNVAVSADPDVPHGTVVEVLDQAAASGAAELDVVDPNQGSDHGA